MPSDTALPRAAAAMSLSAQAKARLLALLSTDYTEGKNLLDVTSSLVLRNIVEKIQTDSEKAYRVLRIILPYMLLAGSVYTFFSKLFVEHSLVRIIWTWLSDPVTSSIAIPATNPLNQDVLQWLVTHGLGENPRALTLYSGNSNVEHAVKRRRRHPYDYLDEANSMLHAEPQSHDPEPLKFIPEFGRYTFRRGCNLLSVRRERPGIRGLDPTFGGHVHNHVMEDNDPASSQPIVITCFPTFQGTAPIQRFLEDIRGFSVPEQKDTTTVFKPKYHYNGSVQWNTGTSRPARSLDSVALEAVKKEVIVNDIATYLSPECEEWYSARGIPYRRGFLLYGPPGTGKTSFSVAVAGHFKLNVYVISMSEPRTTDSALEILFEAMPRRCIVLIEDVDAAGLRREKSKLGKEKARETNDDPFAGLADPFSGIPLLPTPTGLTLSGLLNVLDGPCSKDGRILLMTSNAPDSLDPALVRPGRCDRKILFGYAGREVSEKLFMHIYTKVPGEQIEGEEEVPDKYDVPTLAREFASLIPEDDGGRITPAEIQGYLMQHREDPEAALRGAVEWMEEIIELKARGALVAEFANEIDGPSESATTPHRAAQSSAGSGDQDSRRRGSLASSDARSEGAETACTSVDSKDQEKADSEKQAADGTPRSGLRSQWTPGCCCS